MNRLSDPLGTRILLTAPDWCGQAWCGSVQGFTPHSQKLLAAQFLQLFRRQRQQVFQHRTQHTTDGIHGCGRVTLGAPHGFGNDLVDQAKALEVLSSQTQRFRRRAGLLGVTPQDGAQASGEITE